MYFFSHMSCSMNKLKSHMLSHNYSHCRKQPLRGVFKKRCSENMQQIYRRTPMPKCDFNKVASNFTEIALRHGCSPVNLLYIFRIPFPRNSSGWLLQNCLSFNKESKGSTFVVNVNDKHGNPRFKRKLMG